MGPWSGEAGILWPWNGEAGILFSIVQDQNLDVSLLFQELKFGGQHS